MKRVIVIGCSGSGKSHFSRLLRDKTGLPLYHLDMIYWKADGSYIPKPEFVEKLRRIMDGEKWIIDGNYCSTMEMRIQACDTVFFLDYPTELCLAGILQRKGKPRSDMAWQNPLEDDDEEFVEFVKNYNAQTRPKVMELLERYSDKNIIIFSSREDSEKYLKLL